MRKHSIVTLSFCMATLWSATAAAALKTAACADLVRLGQELDTKQVVPVNKAEGRIGIAALFAGPRMEQVFGKRALEWTPEEVAAAAEMTGACASEAKKAKRAQDGQALTALRQGLGGLRSALASIASTDQKLEKQLASLVEAPPVRPALVAFGILLGAREGTAAALQKVDRELKEHANRVGSWHPVQTQSLNLAATLRDAQASSWAEVFPALEKRIAQLKPWAVEDATAALNGMPETIDGLRRLPNELKKIRTELTGGLSDAELAGLDKVAAARREAIEDALVGQEKERIGALPATPDGLNLLRLSQQSPVRAALSPRAAAAFDRNLTERREAIGNAVAEEQIRQLDRFPATLEGLTEIDAFRANTARGLEQLAGAGPAAKFREAAAKKATRIGEEAFPAFRKAIAGLPESDEGLTQFDAAVAPVRGPAGNLDASVRSKYLDAITKRREEIVAAVAKEDARLAKLPLPGGIFADPKGGAKMEFRSRTKVYVTVLRDVTTEASYEVDGERVIIRTPTENTVMTRDGAWLRGGGLNLKRQAEK